MLESAFNIVYRRPNRPFLRGKFLATMFMAGSGSSCSAAIIAGSFGYDLLQRFSPGFVGNVFVAYAFSVVLSSVAVFVFLVAAYERLTNAELTLVRCGPAPRSPLCSCR